MPGAYNNKIFAMLGMALMLALGSCGKDAAPTATSTAPAVHALPQVKRGPSVEELTAGMVQATPLGRSALKLDLKFELGGKPAKGAPLELNLALIPLDAANQTTVTVNSFEGFEAPDPKQFDFDHLDVGEVYRHTLKLTPNGDGVLLVGLTVSVNREDGPETKEFSIPVIVGH